MDRQLEAGHRADLGANLDQGRCRLEGTEDGGKRHIGRIATLEWLFWQMAGLGPMTGQYGHFNVYAPDSNTLTGAPP